MRVSWVRKGVKIVVGGGVSPLVKGRISLLSKKFETYLSTRLQFLAPLALPKSNVSLKKSRLAIIVKPFCAVGISRNNNFRIVTNIWPRLFPK